MNLDEIEALHLWRIAHREGTLYELLQWGMIRTMDIATAHLFDIKEIVGDKTLTAAANLPTEIEHLRDVVASAMNRSGADEFWAHFVNTTVVDQLTQFGVDQYAETLRDHGVVARVNYDLYDSEVGQTILEAPNRLSNSPNVLWDDHIAPEIVEGVQAGESIPDLADRVRLFVPETYSNRAQTIARTEVVSASNAAQHVAGKNFKLGHPVWMATHDERTRRTHLDRDGEPADDDHLFHTPDGSVMKYPGDPNGSAAEVINCRCTLVYVPENDRHGLGDDVREQFSTRAERLERLTRLAAAGRRAGQVAHIGSALSIMSSGHRITRWAQGGKPPYEVRIARALLKRSKAVLPRGATIADEVTAARIWRKLSGGDAPGPRGVKFDGDGRPLIQALDDEPSIRPARLYPDDVRVVGPDPDRLVEVDGVIMVADDVDDVPDLPPGRVDLPICKPFDGPGLVSAARTGQLTSWDEDNGLCRILPESREIMVEIDRPSQFAYRQQRVRSVTEHLDRVEGARALDDDVLETVTDHQWGKALADLEIEGEGFGFDILRSMRFDELIDTDRGWRQLNYSLRTGKRGFSITDDSLLDAAVISELDRYKGPINPRSLDLESPGSLDVYAPPLSGLDEDLNTVGMRLSRLLKSADLATWEKSIIDSFPSLELNDIEQVLRGRAESGNLSLFFEDVTPAQAARMWIDDIPDNIGNIQANNDGGIRADISKMAVAQFEGNKNVSTTTDAVFQFLEDRTQGLDGFDIEDVRIIMRLHDEAGDSATDKLGSLWIQWDNAFEKALENENLAVATRMAEPILQERPWVLLERSYGAVSDERIIENLSLFTRRTEYPTFASAPRRLNAALGDRLAAPNLEFYESISEVIDDFPSVSEYLENQIDDATRIGLIDWHLTESSISLVEEIPLWVGVDGSTFLESAIGRTPRSWDDIAEIVGHPISDAGMMPAVADSRALTEASGRLTTTMAENGYPIVMQIDAPSGQRLITHRQDLMASLPPRTNIVYDSLDVLTDDAGLMVGILRGRIVDDTLSIDMNDLEAIRRRIDDRQPSVMWDGGIFEDVTGLQRPTSGPVIAVVDEPRRGLVGRVFEELEPEEYSVDFSRREGMTIYTSDEGYEAMNPALRDAGGVLDRVDEHVQIGGGGGDFIEGLSDALSVGAVSEADIFASNGYDSNGAIFDLLMGGTDASDVAEAFSSYTNKGSLGSEIVLDAIDESLYMHELLDALVAAEASGLDLVTDLFKMTDWWDEVDIGDSDLFDLFKGALIDQRVASKLDDSFLQPPGELKIRKTKIGETLGPYRNIANRLWDPEIDSMPKLIEAIEEGRPVMVLPDDGSIVEGVIDISPFELALTSDSVTSDVTKILADMIGETDMKTFQAITGGFPGSEDTSRWMASTIEELTGDDDIATLFKQLKAHTDVFKLNVDEIDLWWDLDEIWDSAEQLLDELQIFSLDDIVETFSLEEQVNEYVFGNFGQEWWQNVGSAFYGGEPAIDAIRDLIDNFVEDAPASLAEKGRRFLYRGWPGAPQFLNINMSDLDSVMEGSKRIIGEIYEDAGFTSTSTDPLFAEDWAGNSVMLAIDAPEGVKVPGVDARYGHWAAEHEIILPPNTRMVYGDIIVTNEGGRYKMIIQARLLPDQPVPGEPPLRLPDEIKDSTEIIDSLIEASGRRVIVTDAIDG